MNKNTIIAVAVIALVAIIGAVYFYLPPADKAATNTPVVGGDRDTHGCIGSAGYSWCEAKQKCARVWEEYCTAATPSTATFMCDGGKVIDATFYPTDDLFVDLVLSDSRALTVPHAISASGARYANKDETFVFWNKGETAFITEGTNASTTFGNCLTVSK